MPFSSCVSPDPSYKGETAIVGEVKVAGEPLAGAYIRLLDAGKDFVGEVQSDAAGKFTFFAGAGDWYLVCLAPGDARLEEKVALDKGQELQVTFAL
jgi:hypothetical protein